MSANDADIIENTIRRHDDLLEILLTDRTRTTKRKVHHLLWGTNMYAGHAPQDEIEIAAVTDENTLLIQPRIAKSKDEQIYRTKDRAEVFTPRDTVATMNQMLDWAGTAWPVTEKTWRDYVRAEKLEITCGEAPFIVGRYNAVNGKKVLKLDDRAGFLDRKLQVVGKYCQNKSEWLEWAKVAFQSSYGYEWQGDNLLLARENLLYTFIDYWNTQFPDDKINLERQVSAEKMSMLQEIATIISWNLFQMDGVRFVVPMSCEANAKSNDSGKKSEDNVLPLLAGLDWKSVSMNAEAGGSEPDRQQPDQRHSKRSKRSNDETRCPGCRKKDPRAHAGIYVKIMDWSENKVVRFVDLVSRVSQGRSRAAVVSGQQSRGRHSS